MFLLFPGRLLSFEVEMIVGIVSNAQINFYIELAVFGEVENVAITPVILTGKLHLAFLCIIAFALVPDAGGKIVQLCTPAGGAVLV